MAKTRKIGRDAGNGQFIPVEKAKENPKTTTIETIKPAKSSPPPKKKK